MTTIQGKAAILFAPNTPLTVANVTFDPPKKGEVRVKVKATGLCHSDMYLLKGLERGGNDITHINGPVIPGHEGAGIVESVGEGVTKVKPGDHVILQWMTQCNDCIVCTEKPMTNACLQTDFTAMLLRKDGTSRIKVGQDATPVLTFLGTATFAEYAILEESNVCLISPKIPFEVAALVGCCLGTGYGSALNIAKVCAGSVCVIWGLGAVGLSTIIGCKAAGAKKILAIDRLPNKGQLAKEVGATDFLCTADIPEADLLAKIRGQYGVDYAFECSGSVGCLEIAQKSLAVWGSLTVVGLHPVGAEITVLAERLLLGQTFSGGFYGQYKPLDGIDIVTKEILEGRLQSAEKLITHRLPLEQINEGFDLLEAGKAIRAVIIM